MQFRLRRSRRRNDDERGGVPTKPERNAPVVDGLSPAGEKQQDLSGTARILILLAAIYCYFAGWIYAYHLFAHFGLSFSAVDIPPYYFFVYSYFVLPRASFTSVGIGLIVAAAICGLAMAASRFKSAQWLLGMTLIGMFPVVFYFARDGSDEAARRIRGGDAHLIKFVLKNDVAREYPQSFLDANLNERLMLLTETKDHYYVFFQPPSKERSFPFGYTYDVAKAHVVVTTIEVQSTSKGEPRQ